MVTSVSIGGGGDFYVHHAFTWRLKSHFNPTQTLHLDVKSKLQLVYSRDHVRAQLF
jgi:hypothetical protein